MCYEAHLSHADHRGVHVAHHAKDRVAQAPHVSLERLVMPGCFPIDIYEDHVGSQRCAL